MKALLLIVLCIAIPVQGQQSETLSFQTEKLKTPGGEIDAEVGRLVVPENRTNKDARPIELAVIRVRTRAAKPASPIVFLAGGPGNSGTSAARDPRSLAAFARLAEFADVIFLDQRSTGRSSPILRCGPAGPVPADVVFADRAKFLDGFREALTACASEWRAKGADLSGYNTNESADDIESLRLALKAPKISLFGFSYGTHLALASIRRHGDTIDRVVLVGSEGPDHTLKLPRSTETQIRKLSRLLTEDGEAAKTIPDLAGLLRQVLVSLDRQPAVVTVQNPQTKEAVTIPVRSFGLQRILAADLGDGNDIPQLPAMVKLIADGDVSLLSQYVQKRYNQMGRGVGLMPFLMDCASGATASRAAQIRAEASESAIADIINFPFPDVCAALGVPSLPDTFRAPVVSDVPALFISGTLDNNTPPYQAEEIRWGFVNGTHLIVENAGHEDTLPNPEVQRALADFLRGQDVSDRRIAMPKPKFLSLEEARRLKLQ